VATRARVYESLDPISREEAEEALGSDEPRRISRALLRLSLHGPDWEHAERRATELLDHPDVWVRRNACTAPGHISRLHGRLDVNVAFAALVALLDDPEVVDWADLALDDVEHYLKLDRRRFKRRKRNAGA
jgi:hypothetical protein